MSSLLPHSFRCRTHIRPVLCPPKAEPLFKLFPTPSFKPQGGLSTFAPSLKCSQSSLVVHKAKSKVYLPNPTHPLPNWYPEHFHLSSCRPLSGKG